MKRFDAFEKFITDLFLNAQIKILALDSLDLLKVVGNIQKYGLDFDDSYQATLALKYDLTIISFDKDFNAKGIKKQTPEEFIGDYH